MALVLPNQGLPSLLDWMIRHTGGDPPDLVMTLFTNNLTPTQTTVFADLVRATFGGFSERVLTRSGWTVPVISSGKSVSTWGTTPYTWTCTSDPETLYGWAAYDPGPMQLVIVERFDSPRPVTVGNPFGLLPRLTLTTEPP